MKDIDLNKLKELAQHVNYGGFTVGDSGFGVESSDGTFADCLGMDEASFIYAANPVVVLALIERLEVAECERETLQRAVDNLDSERKALRAEIARRDAAAVEPVAWQFLSDNGKWLDSYDHKDAERYGYKTRPLYAVAQPAVLPPEYEAQTMSPHELEFTEGYNQCRADAKARGYQPEKVLMLPESFNVDQCHYSDDIDVIPLEALTKALDAAGVKYETTPPADD